ncbi:unnamed protein product [Blepharisma stoltei]|uniref:Uncharacterized protein n=1 Tax=Blepharisma stoltei TaxID=1481888 RepID=A0AAU9K0J3_9CILI|nr:unnamed protein product [Blepharisma stoltei]
MPKEFILLRKHKYINMAETTTWTWRYFLNKHQVGKPSWEMVRHPLVYIGREFFFASEANHGTWVFTSGDSLKGTRSSWTTDSFLACRTVGAWHDTGVISRKISPKDFGARKSYPAVQNSTVAEGGVSAESL